MNPQNMVFDAKRLIGRKYTGPSVQEDIKHWPFKVVDGPDHKPLIEGEHPAPPYLKQSGLLSPDPSQSADVYELHELPSEVADSPNHKPLVGGKHAFRP